MDSNSNPNPIFETTGPPLTNATNDSVDNTAMPSSSSPLISLLQVSTLFTRLSASRRRAAIRANLESNPEPKCDSEPEPESEVVTQSSLEEEERNMVARFMEDGFHLLLAGQGVHQCTLLGLKVILEIEPQQILTNFKDLELPTCGDKLPTYKLRAEEAVGLLLDYEEFWIHSCSIVLPEGALSRLRDRVLSSDLCGQAKANNQQPIMEYAEVMLFILTNYEQIDDSHISDKKQFSEFLNKIDKKKILKVHAICSTFTMKEEDRPTYSHLLIPDKELGRDDKLISISQE